ncbi:MAG: hypothetical protein JW782_02990 [Candidatus Saganbacteria bacterium]|nr:hypothetical protein [Candidatus Saganbacteria bacterium]
MDILGINVDSVIDFGRDVADFFGVSGSSSGCSSPEAVDLGRVSETLASDLIVLSRPEVDAIMSMNPGHGNACAMVDLPSGETATFWNNAAQYIIDTKYSTDFRNEDPNGLGASLARLSRNQHDEVISRLAARLAELGRPYNVMPEREYAWACSHGIWFNPLPFPSFELNVSRNQIALIIADVLENVPAETAAAGPACEEPNVCMVPPIDLPAFFVVSSLSPNSGRQDESVTVTISGTPINFFGEDNALPEGLEIDLGEGITVTEISRTSNGNLQAELQIARDADRTTRPLLITVNGAFSGTLCNAFTVERRASSGSHGHRAMTPAVETTEPQPEPQQPSGLNFGSRDGI